MGTRSISSPTMSLSMLFNVRNTINSDTDTVSVQIGQTVTKTYTSGTTDSKFDRGWESLARALTTGTTETIDLYDLGSLDIGAGAGLDPTGQSYTNAELVAWYVSVTAASTGSLYMGGEGTTAAFQSLFGVSEALSDTGQIVFPPGTAAMAMSTNDPAWAIADTSNHLLQFAAVGGNVTYDVGFAFRSA